MWSGTVISGQTVKFGSFGENIPAGKVLIGAIFTPRSTLDIVITYDPLNYYVYGYSSCYNGSINYDALLILK